MGRKRFRPKCEGQRRSTLPPRSLKHCPGHYPKRCVANSQTSNKRSQSSHGFLLSSGIEESSQVALKRLFSRRPSTRSEPVFEVSDSNPMLNLGLFNRDRNRRILMNLFHPVPLPKDMQATRYGFIETARRDFDRVFRAGGVETRYFASSKTHAVILASSFFFRQN